ncbi:MAG TPA: DMT family transporter [Anaerolineae bacterium]|nr:DMT family transporter [Anaerolineae bacterium]
MGKHYWQANGLLLLTAIIWGFAFVAQRVGMDYVGPFTYNAVRFALGGLALLLLMPLLTRSASPQTPAPASRSVLKNSLLVGVVLFGGATFQQVGVANTTAGKAGFITGLYVVLVPILGLLWKQRTAPGTWLGALLAVGGLYLLSVTEKFTMATGDLQVLIGAGFWAVHIQLLAHLSTHIAPIKLAAYQFLVCAILSFGAALIQETITAQGLRDALIPILYGGLISVGIAYTLQVVALRDAHPAHASILMSLEAVFALVGGMLLLQESLALRGIVGCALMLAGTLLSQLWGVPEREPSNVKV